MYMLRRPPSPGNARFKAVSVLAAGLMLSCTEAPRESPDSEPLQQASVAPRMALPPAPKARADADYQIGYTVGCPLWMVRVPDSPYDFCIDRFEDVVGIRKNGAITIHDSSKALGKDTPMDSIIAMVSPIMLPQSSITKPQAEKACQNAEKRLCTLHEWKRACMGPLNTTYPYGNAEAPRMMNASGKLVKEGKCNTRKPHILGIFHGEDNSKWTKADMRDPIQNKVKGFLAKPGEFRECVSGYGAYDLVGNLHEWVSDLVDQRILDSMPNTGTQIPGVVGRVGNSITAGGYYGTGNDNGPGCHFKTIAHGADQDDYSVGFRCCKTVE